MISTPEVPTSLMNYHSLGTLHSDNEPTNPSLSQESTSKGHFQLFVRSLVSLSQSILCLMLSLRGIDAPHNVPLALCQLAASTSLTHQFLTNSTLNFLLRALISILRVCISLHLSACGRHWLSEGCDSAGWWDVRAPFRGLAFCEAVRMSMETLSFIRHYYFPNAGVSSKCGNEQLYYRGLARSFGVPINLLQGVLKPLLLTGTNFERTGFEISGNFTRALILVPISASSLFVQYTHTRETPLLSDPRSKKVNAGGAVLGL